MADGYNEEKKEGTQGEGEEEKKFSFLQEKIKEKRSFDWRKELQKVYFTVFLAVVFGVVAGYVFVVAVPYIQQRVNPEEPSPVVIDQDDEMQEAGEEEAQDEAPEADPVIIQEKVSVELEDYESLFNKMSVLAAECSRGLVTVTCATSETDWFNNLMENQHHGTGAIVADNGLELLVLTERKLLEDAERISVTFADGTIADAALKAYDGNTGLAVLSIEKRGLSEETRNALEIVELGNSNLVTKGAPIIAAGSPLEYENAAVFGNITSQSNYKRTSDANYKILTTDILGSVNGTGVLLNMKGEVIGIISQDIGEGDSSSTVMAYAISDIKGIIEKLSNGEDIAYMGIRGMDVTAEISEAAGMPQGVYVEVEMDSPAMAAGIQNGDVITAINNEPIVNMKAIQNIMLEFEPEQALNVQLMRLGKDGYVEMKYVVTLGKL